MRNLEDISEWPPLWKPSETFGWVSEGTSCGIAGKPESIKLRGSAWIVQKFHQMFHIEGAPETETISYTALPTFQICLEHSRFLRPHLQKSGRSCLNFVMNF